MQIFAYWITAGNLFFLKFIFELSFLLVFFLFNMKSAGSFFNKFTSA